MSDDIKMPTMPEYDKKYQATRHAINEIQRLRVKVKNLDGILAEAESAAQRQKIGNFNGRINAFRAEMLSIRRAALSVKISLKP